MEDWANGVETEHTYRTGKSYSTILLMRRAKLVWQAWTETGHLVRWWGPCHVGRSTSFFERM